MYVRHLKNSIQLLAKTYLTGEHFCKELFPFFIFAIRSQDKALKTVNWLLNIFKKKEKIDPTMKYLIVGLGNPGPEYFDTRHNVGFRVLDHLADQFSVEFSVKSQGLVTELKHKGRQIHLLKPSTFMNHSGKAVTYWMSKLKVSQDNVLVVVDDLALPFQKQRLRGKGDNGGHNGLKDIEAKLGNNKFSRLRIGIGDDFNKGRQVDYVLGTWTEEERQHLPDILDVAAKTVLSYCTIGLQFTMNTFNKK